MLEWIALALMTGAGMGVVVLFLMGLSVRRHARESPRVPTRDLPPMSILKPLCGVDEDLHSNLELFATLDYPKYELVLGVRDETDAAYEVARQFVQKYPARVRLVLQSGEPGFNPKVNQLITMQEAARYDLLVVSDSNASVPPGYLQEIAAHFEDDDVGCVSHPVVGGGERSLGALLDNYHLSSAIGPGQVSAKRVTNKDLVVGKSMALRRGDLEAIGGFLACKDVLAEDYVIGHAVTGQLGKRVVIAHLPVYNVSRHRSTAEFFRRYIRWSIIHRTAVRLTTYLGQSLLNPAPLAMLAAVLHPTLEMLGLAAAITFLKALSDYWQASTLRRRAFSARAFFVTPLKDVLIFFAWVNGLYTSHLTWRGNRLKVVAGSRLVPIDGEELASDVRPA